MDEIIPMLICAAFLIGLPIYYMGNYWHRQDQIEKTTRAWRYGERR